MECLCALLQVTYMYLAFNFWLHTSVRDIISFYTCLQQNIHVPRLKSWQQLPFSSERFLYHHIGKFTSKIGKCKRKLYQLHTWKLHMHALVYIHLLTIIYNNFKSTAYGRTQQDLSLQKYFCRCALTAAMQMLVEQPLGKLHVFFTVVKGCFSKHLFHIPGLFGRCFLSCMCREKNILSSRKLKKPRQCFVNLPGQTHVKTDQYLSPLCFEERSWKKCQQGRDHQHQSGASQQMNLLILVTQIRKTNLLIEVTEEMGNAWKALVLWTVALTVMWVTFSYSNLLGIRTTWWLMSFYYYH